MQRVGIDLRSQPRLSEDPFQLGREGENAILLGVVKGLHAVRIARKVHPTRTRVPYSEGEDPVQTGGAVEPPFLVGVNDGFCVCTRGEAVTARFQLATQLAMVVDLAVEDHDNRPVLVRDRLISCDEVDDREAPDTERDSRVVVEVLTALIGPAMPQQVARASEVASIDRTAASAIVDTNDPAHRISRREASSRASPTDRGRPPAGR
jgi:hypothetical protein